jgi:translation initiation factor 5
LLYINILFIRSSKTDPTKYFGCELGAQTQFDFKNERFIVNGSHDSAKLQDLLDG